MVEVIDTIVECSFFFGDKVDKIANDNIAKIAEKFPALLAVSLMTDEVVDVDGIAF